MKFLFLVFSIAVIVGHSSVSQAQTIRTWDSTHNRNAWLSARNWSPSTNFAGDTNNGNATAEGALSDLAVINAVGFAGSQLGINMNSSNNNGILNNTGANGLLQLGAIDFTSALNVDLTIGKSDTSLDGHLQLNGISVDSVANIILRNSSSRNITIANTAGGSGTMGLRLGNLQENVISIVSTGNVTISNVVSSAFGATPLTIRGTGTGRLDVTGVANTFTGGINILGSEVRFSANGSMGNSANTITIDGGRFATANATTFSTARNFFVGDGAGTSISTTGSGTLTLTGVIANKTGEIGSWAKQGSGVLELGGVSTYTGNTAINSGTLRLISGDNRLPTGTVVSLGQEASGNLGTLDLNGRNQTIAGLQSVAGTNAGASTNIVTSATAAVLTINNNSNFTYSAGTAANSGVITGAIALVKSGSGTQTLGGANSYSGGTTVQAGSLIVGNNTALGTGSVSVTGGTLDLTGRSITNSLTELSGNGSVVGGTITNSGAFNVTRGSISSALAGTAGLIKSGTSSADQVILSGLNTYTGTTVISGGTLSINGSHAGGGAYTVNADGTLGGTGSIQANVNVVGGTLAAGNSIGTLTVTGNVVLDAASSFEVEIDSTAFTSDFLAVSGQLNLGDSTLDLVDLAPFSVTSGTLNIASYGSLVGTFSGLIEGSMISFAGNQWLISYGSGTNDFVSLQAVPEPTALLMVGGALAFGSLRRRRKFVKAV